MTPRFERTPHLVALVGAAERLAATLRAAEPPAGVVGALVDDAVVASLQLDGSTIPTPPSDVDLALAAAHHDSWTIPEVAHGSWADALRTRDDVLVEDTRIWAREYAGVRAAVESDDLVDSLVDDFVPALVELHRRLTHDLIAPKDIGQLRRSQQAVHDTSIGRVIYYPSSPTDISRDLHLLGAWVAGEGGREHPLVVAGVVHEGLLRIHPFESANGRLARAASRLLLRKGDLDPHGLALTDRVMGADAIGVFEEVARTRLRRDLTVWLERWGETVTAGLRRGAHALDLQRVDVPSSAKEAIRERGAFTIADYRTARGATTAAARDELDLLLDAGLVQRVLGSRGLRFVTVL